MSTTSRLPMGRDLRFVQPSANTVEVATPSFVLFSGRPLLNSLPAEKQKALRAADSSAKAFLYFVEVVGSSSRA